MSSGKWRPFCLGLNVLNELQWFQGSVSLETTIIPGIGILIIKRRQSKTRTTRMPAFWGYPPPPHDYPYHWVILDPKSKEDKVKVTNLKNSPKFQIFEFWNWHYTRHTFLSCLIRCANMKWIRWILLKIQSGHDSVHRRTDGRTDRRTDGQGDTSIPPINFVEAGGIKTIMCIYILVIWHLLLKWY